MCLQSTGIVLYARKSAGCSLAISGINRPKAFGAVLPVPAVAVSMQVRGYAAKPAKGGKSEGGGAKPAKTAKIAKAAKPGEKIAKIAKGARKDTEDVEDVIDEEARARAALVTRIEDLTEEELKARQKVVAGVVLQKCSSPR